LRGEHKGGGEPPQSISERKGSAAPYQEWSCGGELAMSMAFGLVVAAACLGLMILGGGFYEVLVVDPAWPKRPDLIQPERGGISRRRFWVPVHSLFELTVILALIAGWSDRGVRWWLWVALIIHAVGRVWSFADFIPKAIAFERAEPGSITEEAARRWTRRSWFRLPVEMLSCGATIAAVVRVARM
jgi:hypothetical protein